MSKRLEIQGKRFGKLVAVEELPKVDGMRCWRLVCDCGGERVTLQKSFASGGGMKCCGCTRRERKGKGVASRVEYKHWTNMKSRCNNPNTPYFEHYGGRGIRICPGWETSFERFLADMGPRPGPGWTIDRIDANGDYSPDNCRWATKKTQARNTRTNRIVKFKDRAMTLAEAAEPAPVSYNTILHRLRRGWSIEDALSRRAARGVRL